MAKPGGEPVALAPLAAWSIGLLGFAAAAIICAAQTSAGAAGALPPEQEILRSRYRLLGSRGSLGSTDLTEFRRADGSRSYLARERMEFWGPVLDRFVVLTFDAQGHFDSGHWVGTSEYSPSFTYTLRNIGGAIRGDWDDTVRGRGWSEVPTRPENPVMGFWGPLESRLLSRFDGAGANRQEFDAVDVEDSHHRVLKVWAEKLGDEDVDVPAGHFRTVHFRTERFGPTDHWLDAHGTLIRWSSEDNVYRWELEHYPSPDPPPLEGEEIARGTYDVTSNGTPAGSVPWRLVRTPGGEVHVDAHERLNQRTSDFEGVLDGQWRWTGSTETARWRQGEGDGPPEIHHLETFFYRQQVHLLRFRDRAYPLLQTRTVTGPVPFYAVDYPISAMTWLRQVPRVPGRHQLSQLAHIGNRYRGGGLEVQAATATYLGASGGRASPPGFHYLLKYPGGWDDATSEFWTDAHFVPERVVVTAGDRIEFKLRDYVTARTW
jgi:hypothetical protein